MFLNLSLTFFAVDEDDSFGCGIVEIEGRSSLRENGGHLFNGHLVDEQLFEKEAFELRWYSCVFLLFQRSIFHYYEINNLTSHS